MLNSVISDYVQERIEPDVSHLFSDPVTVELAQSMEQYLLPLTQQDWRRLIDVLNSVDVSPRDIASGSQGLSENQ